MHKDVTIIIVNATTICACSPKFSWEGLHSIIFNVSHCNSQLGLLYTQVLYINHTMNKRHVKSHG